MLILSVLSGCVSHTKVFRQTEYHDRVSGMERYVIAEMGDYVAFSEPRFNDSQKTLVLSISLVTDYTSDDELAGEYTPLEVMEDTRMLINDYLVSDESRDWKDYSLDFWVYIAPDGSALSDVDSKLIGKWSNRIGEASVVQDELCSVDYDSLLTRESIADIQGVEIRQLYLDKYRSDDIEDVLFMIDHLPDLEYVVVSESIVSDIEQERPDLGVIGV